MKPSKMTPPFPVRLPLGAALLVLVSFLAACASPTHRAPVEDRQPAAGARSTPPATTLPGGLTVASGPTAAAEPAPKPLPGAENAGKPGYYTVRPGDTLIRLGLENGQNWRDIARWSGLDNPNVIEVGQVLRVAPPASDAPGASTRPVAAAGRIESRPLDASAVSSPTASAPAAAPAAAAAPTSAGAPVAAAAASAAVLAPRDGEAEPNWLWPAAGPVATPFDEAKSKGLAIAGKAGDPVYSAADGRVVYAGAGLRGYGNLVIVKHNATYLTAYAHNQTLLVKEDQVVRRGQKIAEMGSSDAERVQLHFEVRRLGKPVDPARLLPPR
jgi:lipoprotein NlpD